MALIGLNATLFRAEKNILVVESRDSSLESSVPSSVLSWSFWDFLATSARLGLMGTKLAFIFSLESLHSSVELRPSQEHETCSKEWICPFQFCRISILSHLPRHTERCWQSSHHPISLAFWWKTKEAFTTLLLLRGHLQMILLPPAFEMPTLYRGLN